MSDSLRNHPALFALEGLLLSSFRLCFCHIPSVPNNRSEPILFLARSFLLGYCHSPGSLAGPRICMRALPPHRQTPPMPQPSVTTDVHQPLDVHLDLFPQIAFDIALLIYNGPYPVDLFLCQLTNPPVRAYVSLAQNLVSTRSADPIYVCKTNLNPLISR